MKKRHSVRCLSLLLVAALLLSLLSGCGGGQTAETGEPVKTTEPTAPPSSAAAERGEMPENAVLWRDVFSDKSLPADGYLTEHEIAFYLRDKDGAGSVTLMTLDELYGRVAAMEPLPRTHFFEDLLDERFRPLFAAFDMTMELGALKFCFPTADLRAGDVTGHFSEFEYSFPLSFSSPHISCGKDYRDENGEAFHYMTVVMNCFDYSHMRNYLKAMREARAIVDKLPEELDQLGKAKYLYRYVSTLVSYNNGDYYGSEDPSYLYDSLILHSAVCTGYAESVYVLFNLAGIECLKVRGYVGSKLDGHAWNLAKLDGVWYQLDATWDSELWLTDRYEPLYFCVSDQTIDSFRDREYSDFFAPLAPPCEVDLDTAFRDG